MCLCFLLTIFLSHYFCFLSARRLQDREERAVKSAPQPLVAATSTISTSVATNSTATTNNIITANTAPSLNTTTNTILATSTSAATSNAAATHAKSAVSPQESILEEPEPESMIKRILALKAKESGATVQEKVTN